MKSILSIILLSIIWVPSVIAQQPSDTSSVVYRFAQGQVVNYRVFTRDSIGIYDTTMRIIIREREEGMRIRCDSVLPDGAFILTWMLTGYVGRTRMGTLPMRTDSTHPWVGRAVTFIMERSGRRRSQILYDSSVADYGNAPGGPLQPPLLPDLGMSPAKKSDVYQTSQLMYENTFPPVIWSGKTYRVNSRRNDTLAQKTIAVEITQAAATSYTSPRLPGKPVPPKLIARINGGGTYSISPQLGYPVCGQFSFVANLEIKPADSTQPTLRGRHVLATLFYLETPEVLRAIQANVKAIERRNNQIKPMLAPKKRIRK